MIDGLSRAPRHRASSAAIIATIVVAPLAYVSTSIVLGDVGAIEALSRSWRLYRARRLLAVVVVLFTLVTSAIQLFALRAGLDLVVRAGELSTSRSPKARWRSRLAVLDPRRPSWRTAA